MGAAFYCCWPQLLPSRRPYAPLRDCCVDEQTGAALTPAGNPLPPAVHAKLTPKALGPGRVVVIGDVHGCLAELFHLLDTVRFDWDKDNLLLTGDISNKGPNSQQTVAAVRVLSAGGRCWSVRGNNDDLALKAWRDWHDRGVEPVTKKHRWVPELLPEDVAFLDSLPFSLTLPDYNLSIVHGGLLPGIPMEQQDLAVVSRMRDIMREADGTLVGLERACEGSEPWAQYWQGPGFVVFGHDSARRLQAREFCVGIDTACATGGQLTALVLPPLDELQRGQNTVRRGQPTTLRDLGGYLVSVPSFANWAS